MKESFLYCDILLEEGGVNSLKNCFLIDFMEIIQVSFTSVLSSSSPSLISLKMLSLPKKMEVLALKPSYNPLKVHCVQIIQLLSYYTIYLLLK